MPAQFAPTNISRRLNFTPPPRLWGGKMMPRAAGRAALAIRLAVLALLLAAVAGMLSAPGAGEVAAQGNKNYARGGDPNLINIETLAQLDAVRYDLNGNGMQDAVSDADWDKYQAAFPNARDGMGCADACTGYELMNSLDFDTNGNGYTHISGNGDPEDTYYNQQKGWTPIGGAYSATFNGNGHTIDNLFIKVIEAIPSPQRRYSSLFRRLSASGTIVALGVRNAYLTETGYPVEPDNRGILVGHNYGNIVACYTTGFVRGYSQNGGLVGHLESSGVIRASYSTASVRSVASGGSPAGGLAGSMQGGGTIAQSYYTGTLYSADVPPKRGGLVGHGNVNASIPADTYWDTTTTGVDVSFAPGSTGLGSSRGTGKTTVELQTPTAYGTAETDIYSTWNLDLDGDTELDDPWDFGTDTEYPSLKYGGHRICTQHGRECPPDPEPETEPDEYVAPPIVYNLNIRFNVKGLTLDEGESATYQVRMSQSPVGHPARVSITSNNPDVVVSPTEVTFSSANYRQWQTVKVSTLRDPNGTNESATLAHRGPSLSYGSILVSVNDTWPGAAVATVNGHTVTVRHTLDAPYGVTVTAPSTLDTNTDITIAGPPPGTPQGAPGYGLGQSAAARMRADIRVSGTPADGLTICLPLPEALVAEAGDHPLTLLRYAAGVWTPVAGAARRDSAGGAAMLCAAGITEYGVFAAAYTLPALGAASDLVAAAGDTPGTITLTWTPGANAAAHWIAGIKQADPYNLAVWQLADAMGSHTISDLEVGATYIFTVTAGRGEGEGSQWSAWAPWATAAAPMPTPTPATNAPRSPLSQ